MSMLRCADRACVQMVKSEGYRCCTRDMFSRPFRKNGMPNLTTYLTNYKLGDTVDIIANSAIQKGMPHKIYHGRPIEGLMG